MRRAGLLPVVDEVADQLPQRPGVERFLVRLKGHQVVRRQVLEAIGQRPGERPGPPANEDEVDELLLERQVELRLHGDGRALEEVDSGQAEQPVQWSVLAHPPCPGGRLVGRWYRTRGCSGRTTAICVSLRAAERIVQPHRAAGATANPEKPSRRPGGGCNVELGEPRNAYLTTSLETRAKTVPTQAINSCLIRIGGSTGHPSSAPRAK
jgi:hypothetical protein